MNCDGVSWQDCAMLTKKAIINAESPANAVAAFGEWAKGFRHLYEAQSSMPVTPPDLDRIEEYVADKIDDYCDPANIALDQAIKQVFPKIASLLEFASSTIVTGVWAFLVPSPIATDLQEAQLANDDLGKLLMVQLAPLLHDGWRDNYDQSIRDALNTPIVLPTP